MIYEILSKKKFALNTRIYYNKGRIVLNVILPMNPVVKKVAFFSRLHGMWNVK